MIIIQSMTTKQAQVNVNAMNNFDVLKLKQTLVYLIKIVEHLSNISFSISKKVLKTKF